MGRIVVMVCRSGKGNSGNDFRNKHRQQFHIGDRYRDRDIRGSDFKIFSLVYDRLIFAARLCQLFVTGRHPLLHFTIIGLGEKRYVPDLSAAKMNAYYKTAAGNQHQEGEGDR